MKINNVDVSTYGATQFKATIGHHTMKDASEWIPSSVLPHFAPLQMGFKDTQVIVNIKDTSRENIITKRSKLLGALRGVVDLELNGFTNKFHVVMTSHRETEVVKNRWHQVELNFSGYEYGSTVTQTASSGTSLTITNPGTLPSPCIVEITPSIGAATMTVSGICRDNANGTDMPVTIKSLTTGNKVTLDGITGLITEGNSLKEVDAWALPSLKPGANTVSWSVSSMTVTVKVMPLYM